MASRVERKYTITSNVSQTPSVANKNAVAGIMRQESRISSSGNKIQERFGNLSYEFMPKKVEKIRDVKKINIKSPKFDEARKKLGVHEDELRVQNKRNFEYDEKGISILLYVCRQPAG